MDQIYSQLAKYIMSKYFLGNISSKYVDVFSFVNLHIILSMFGKYSNVKVGKKGLHARSVYKSL